VISGSQAGEHASSSDQLESPVDRQVARPLSVTLLIVVVLIFTGLNLLRLILTIQSWIFLAGLLPVSPWYLALTGLVWTILGCALIWGLWLRLAWAPNASRLLSGIYMLYYWVDRLFVANRSGLEASWPFTLVVCLMLFLWILWLFTRRKIRNYFSSLGSAVI
jgi:hypothetical protein